MDTPWYFRLFYVPIANMVITGLLVAIIKPKRMGAPDLNKSMLVISMVSMIALPILLWFVSFSINAAFWIGLIIVVLGQVIFALACIAMREHPEKSATVVDWGIYRITRHPHFLSSVVTCLGAIVMGWTTESTMYIIVWIYFMLDLAYIHVAILHEEKRTAEKLGPEYEAYMACTPRYFLI